MNGTVVAAQSHARSPATRARDLAPVFSRDDLEFALLFAGPDDIDQLPALGQRTRLYGCTTSGEITPAG